MDVQEKEEGVHYTEKFAPMINNITICMMLTEAL